MRTKEASSQLLKKLCDFVKESVYDNDFMGCKEKIYCAMSDFPHSAVPHNLIGIVLECEGNHSLAMNHFRAAWALDPLYAPARHNLDLYGSVFTLDRCAFDESDCKNQLQQMNMTKIQDEEGVYHIIKTKELCK